MRSSRNLPRITHGLRHSRGMTLIEVLVTLVITSVGLLGVAALQLTTVRNNYDAFVRSQASTLATDMLDRIRANRGAVAAYRMALGATTPDGPAATVDVTQWLATLDTQLPNARGGIAYDEPTGVVTITVEWSERAQEVADRTLTFSTSSQI